MKIRNDYVSNSSSSSFIIAYDKKFFGDLTQFINTVNCCHEISVYDENEFFKNYYESSNEELDYIKNQIALAKKNNRELLFVNIDYSTDMFLEMLKHMNIQNGRDKLDIIGEIEL